MAKKGSESPDVDKCVDECVQLEDSVNTAFDDIIFQIQERRASLLNRIKNIFTKKQNILRSIKQIESTRSLIQDEMKDNFMNEVQAKTLAQLNNSLCALETEAVHENNYGFFCDTKEFSRALANLGSIDKGPKPYIDKNKAKLSFQKMKSLLSPTRLSVNEDVGLVCVSDHKGRQLLLFTLEGTFVNSFKLDQLKCPVSLKLINNKEVIVSDYTVDSIFRIEFDINKNNKCKTLRSRNYLYVTSLDYDEEMDLIYITASLYGSLQILNRTNLTVAGKVDHSFIFPRCVLVKKSEIFVLDCNNPCIHVLSKSTLELMRSIIPQGIDLNLSNPLGFAIDNEGRVIVSNFHGNSNQIQIYSPFGQLLHSFPQEESILFQPASIYVTKDCDVIIISSNPDTPIQVF